MNFLVKKAIWIQQIVLPKVLKAAGSLEFHPYVFLKNFYLFTIFAPAFCTKFSRCQACALLSLMLAFILYAMFVPHAQSSVTINPLFLIPFQSSLLHCCFPNHCGFPSFTVCFWSRSFCPLLLSHPCDSFAKPCSFPDSLFCGNVEVVSLTIDIYKQLCCRQKELLKCFAIKVQEGKFV